MLRELIPGLRELKLERVGSDTRALLGVFERNGCRYDLKLDELSDGQRILLALYGLLLFSKRGQTQLLDEPENYVSLPEIQPWLMELSDRCGEEGFQVILASHRPEVMDYLGVDYGLLLKQEVSGVTQVRRLKDLANEDEIKLSELLARGWD
jgi:predicted ATPase